MDEFKKYLLTQKDQLESDEPSEKVWAGIQRSIDVPVRSFQLRNWAIAASLIVLAGVGALLMRKSNQTTTPIVKSTFKEIKAPVLENSVASLKTTTISSNKIQNEKPLNFPAASPITTIHSVNELNATDQSKLASMEASFTQVINLQKARISTTPLYAESPNYFVEFHHQLEQMEKDESQIKSYIRKNGMSDELLEQLINVYQQKLNMLKQLQTEMQKLNSRYKQNRPAVDTLKTYFLNL
jgi:hypothetical protein